MEFKIYSVKGDDREKELETAYPFIINIYYILMANFIVEQKTEVSRMFLYLLPLHHLRSR